ncbi:hypothetical protein [Alkalicella caledoniensis]|nr:hypothetical protein [Alkalicella caledoniensis]
MRTDKVIENQTHRMIIDTKYYPNALNKSNLGGKTQISGNL